VQAGHVATPAAVAIQTLEVQTGRSSSGLRLMLNFRAELVFVLRSILVAKTDSDLSQHAARYGSGNAPPKYPP